MQLPKEVALPTEVMAEHNDGAVTAAADWLSDNYDYCVLSLDVVKGKAVNIKWDISD